MMPCVSLFIKRLMTEEFTPDIHLYILVREKREREKEKKGGENRALTFLIDL